MKYIGIIFVALMIAGCVTDGLYNASRTIYIAGKKVVIRNWGELSPETRQKLIEIDRIARKYDHARKTLKPAVKKIIKNVKLSSENKIKSSKSSVGGNGHRE